MSSVLFKKKRRGAAGGSTGASKAGQAPGSSSAPPSPAALPAESDEDPGPAVVVRRGQGKSSGPLAARKERFLAASRVDSSTVKPSGSEAVRRTRVVLDQSAAEEEEGDTFQLRRSKLSQAVRDRTAAVSVTTSDAVQQAPRDEPTSASVQYTSAHLADLKASTPSLHATGEGITSDSAMHIGPAQHTIIPSDREVEVAKQKRIQALQQAAGDDFISLGPGGESSRLVRDTGSDSDEYDTFVADEQALGLSRRARRHNAEEERKKIARTLENVHLGSGETDEDAEEEMAWEAAQLAKFQDTLPAQKTTRRKRDEYVPVPVPEERAVPALSTPHTALRAKLAEVKASISQRQQLIHDAEHMSHNLQEEQEANRSAVEAAAKKSAWFSDLNTFVKDLDSFLAAKFPLLLDLEREIVALTRNEAAKGLHRQVDLLNQLINPDGRPAWPAAPMPAETGYMAIESEAQRAALKARWDQLWADVDAPEFRSAVTGLPDPDDTDDPDEDSRESESGRQSLVGRFATWRARYPDEYMAAWGGLSLAQAWSFWARSDVVAMLLTSPAPGGLPNADKLLSQPWLKAARAYASRTWPTPSGSGQDMGGDEEVVQVLLREAILVPLANVVSGHIPGEDEDEAKPPGGWNPWDKEANLRLAQAVQGLMHAGAEAVDVQALALIVLDEVQAWVQALKSASVEQGNKARFAREVVTLLVATWPWLSHLVSSPEFAQEGQAQAHTKSLLTEFDSLLALSIEGPTTPEVQDLLLSVSAALDYLPFARRLVGPR